MVQDVRVSGNTSPSDERTMIESTTSSRGKVYLVGAGPGDPELLTVKARRLIDHADAILFDSLVGPGILDLLPTDAVTIDVGKRPSDNGKRTTQEDIHELLVSLANTHQSIVRLKGGDPTVYGRGGEEAQQLASAGIPFEIVPGVSSVVAAPGVVGIPLTHREHASSFTVITGHEAAKEESALDWQALADIIASGGTLVILMGVRTLDRNIRRLREAGVEAETPVAMIERATWSDETVLSATADTIVSHAEDAGISAPALTVVGDVVGVRGEILDYIQRDGIVDAQSVIAAPVADQPSEHVPVRVSQQ